MKHFDSLKYIEDNTLRLEASYRGGGIEIDCSEYTRIEGAKMTAYQNYLDGGLLGKVCSDQNFDDKDSKADVTVLRETLKEYFHNLTNHTGDEWEEQTYSQNQSMPVSAY